MKITKLKNYINNGNTVLGIGPVSVNIVDAAIEISQERDTPIMIIASRRQIDSEEFGNGYVNNWSTNQFTQYVKSKQNGDNIILARDHGGPWQNSIEISRRYNLKDALESAKHSFKTDIDCGFDIIHIDPSIDIYHQLSFDKIFERLTELYNFCSDYSIKTNKNIEYEIGTEEQMIHLNNMNDFSSMLKKVNKMCSENNIKKPLFVVTQIGTKVMETRNIGILNQSDNSNILANIEELCQKCLENNYFIKVHNTDYLNHEILKNFPHKKISAANVAPEFGVCETKSFLNILEEHKLLNIENEFLELAYLSKKWEKWIIIGSSISKRDKAIIAGHYVFSKDEFLKIKDKAQKHIKDFEIDNYLKNEVKKNILNYINYFEVKNQANEEAICK